MWVGDWVVVCFGWGVSEGKGKTQKHFSAEHTHTLLFQEHSQGGATV